MKTKIQSMKQFDVVNSISENHLFQLHKINSIGKYHLFQLRTFSRQSICRKSIFCVTKDDVPSCRHFADSFKRERLNAEITYIRPSLQLPASMLKRGAMAHFREMETLTHATKLLANREISGKLSNSLILQSLVDETSFPIKRGFGEGVPDNDARSILWLNWFNYNLIVEQTSRGVMPNGKRWRLHMADSFRLSDHKSILSAVETKLLPGDRGAKAILQEIRRTLAAFRPEVLVPLKRDMKDALGHAREAGVAEEGSLTGFELPLPPFLGSVYASKSLYYASIMACHIGHLLELLSLEEYLVYPEPGATHARDMLIRRGIQTPISSRNSFAQQANLMRTLLNPALTQEALEETLALGAAAVGFPIPGVMLRPAVTFARMCARRIVRRYRPYWFRRQAGATGSETTVPPSAEPAELNTPLAEE